MLILDTHALYWWVNRTPGKLGQQQIDAIETAESLAVSAMTCWEMAWLVKHGRIVLQLPVSDWLDQVEANGVAIRYQDQLPSALSYCPNITKTRLIASLLPRLLNIMRICLVLMGDFWIIRGWLDCRVVNTIFRSRNIHG